MSTVTLGAMEPMFKGIIGPIQTATDQTIGPLEGIKIPTLGNGEQSPMIQTIISKLNQDAEINTASK